MTDLHPKGINMACTLGKHLQVAFIFQGDSSDSSMFDMDGNSRRLHSETGIFNATFVGLLFGISRNHNLYTPTRWAPTTVVKSKVTTPRRGWVTTTVTHLKGHV